MKGRPAGRRGPRSGRGLAVALIAVVALVACEPAPPSGGDGAPAQPSEGARAPVDTRAAAAPAEAPTPAGPVIRPDGIGAARRGMTVGELRRALSPGTVLGPVAPFMVDIDAAPVVAGADTLYRVLFPGLDSIDDSLPLELLATENPAARTPEGVGPGTTLAEAAAIYGPATLSYSVHDESREYAAFASQPEGLRFRVRPASGDAFFAGAYAAPGEYATTTTYDPTAVIWMVMVDLLR